MKNNLKVLCGLALLGSVLSVTTVSCGKRGESSSVSSSPVSQTSESKDSTSSDKQSSSSSTSTVEKKKMLEGLVVDKSNAKVKFNKGEAFETTGLILRVGFSEEGVSGPYWSKLALDAEGVTIDSSKYNKDVVGTYTISISYTYDKAIRYGEYDVEVVDEYDGQLGIDVSVAEGDAKFELSSTNTTCDLTTIASKLVVKEVLKDGSLSESALDASTYEVSYYKGSTKLDDATSINEAGVYQVWVKTTLTRDTKTFTVDNFAFIYVINDVQSIALKAGEGTFTQEAGKDKISSTWKFVATYANGTTKELTSEDVTISIDTKTAGNDKTATVTYEETNPKEEKVTKTTTVTYSVTQPSGTVTVNKTYVFNAETAFGAAASGTIADGTALSTVDETGAATDPVITSYGSKMTYDANTKSFAYGDSTLTVTTRLKMGGASSGTTTNVLKLELEGASTIEVYAMSGSSKDSNRKAYIADSTGTAIATSDALPTSSVGKTTFTVDAAGTYYIGCTAAINFYAIKINSEVTQAQTTSTVYTKFNAETAFGAAASGTIADGTALSTVDETGAATDPVITSYGSKMTYDANTKSFAYGDSTLTVTTRLKMGGASSGTTTNVLKLELEGASTIEVYAMSGSSKDSNRKAYIADSTGTAIATSDALPTSSVGKTTFTVDAAGTYYIGCTAAINIYAIDIVSTVTK